MSRLSPLKTSMDANRGRRVRCEALPGKRARRRGVGVWWAVGVALGIVGCNKPESGQWMLNGFFDPSQVGQFLSPRRTEIRSVVSILEEPTDIQDTEEPSSSDVEPSYADQKVSPGDVLNVSILDLVNPGEAMTQQIRVSASGFETLPVIGRVRMAGLTTREFELEIKERLRTAQILEDAEVQATITESRHNQFSIIGSVQRPGTFALPTPEYRLLNALAEAGGVPPQIEKVYVFRRWGGAGDEKAAPTTRPNSEPEIASFTMSDVSSSPASGPSTMTTSTSSREAVRPATAPSPPSPVDELKILEGQPTEAQPSIRWDPEKGEWVVEAPATASGPAVPEGGGPLVRLARTTSAKSEEGRGPFEGSEELASAQRIIEIPLKELMRGDPRYNVVVRPYDLISVPPGNVGEYYLMGNIARAGAYQLTGHHMTVKEAVASAGGFGPLAWPSRADLIRRIGHDEEQTIQLDLDSIFAGNSPDFYLKPNDVVNVGTNAVAPFLAVLRNAFRLSYGFGFVYDRNFADGDTFGAREQVKQRRFQEATARGLPFN